MKVLLALGRIDALETEALTWVELWDRYDQLFISLAIANEIRKEKLTLIASSRDGDLGDRGSTSL
jgi:hypothetical protein